MSTNKKKLMEDAVTATAAGFINIPTASAEVELVNDEKADTKKKSTKKTIVVEEATAPPTLMHQDNTHASKWALRKYKDENGKVVEIPYSTMSMGFPVQLLEDLTVIAKARKVSRNKLIIDLLADSAYNNPVNVKLANAQRAADKFQADILAAALEEEK